MQLWRKKRPLLSLSILSALSAKSACYPFLLLAINELLLDAKSSFQNWFRLSKICLNKPKTTTKKRGNCNNGNQ